jgi:hypothetical protein
MNNHKITDLKDAENDSDAVNLMQVNSLINSSKSHLCSRDMNNQKIINLKDAENDYDAVNLKQMRSLISDQVNSIMEQITSIWQGSTVRVSRLHTSGYADLSVTRDIPLFTTNFIYAIVVDFKVSCTRLIPDTNESVEEYVSTNDPIIGYHFARRIRIENKWFFLTPGRVQNNPHCIFRGGYRLSYLSFQ